MQEVLNVTACLSYGTTATINTTRSKYLKPFC